MLSERGLQIVDKLIEYNGKPITARILAQELGISERSAKTYAKEVMEYCNKYSLNFTSKPGIGFMADFSENDIKKLEELKKTTTQIFSAKERQSYIQLILLCGWDGYTMGLFSEELNVSKNIINQDIKSVERELKHLGIELKKTLGHGLSVEGEEFNIRKALRRSNIVPFSRESSNDMSAKKCDFSIDYRLAQENAHILAVNFGEKNLQNAIFLIHQVEEKYGVLYTDYSFAMLCEYITIQLDRINRGNIIQKSFLQEKTSAFSEAVADLVWNKMLETKQCIQNSSSNTLANRDDILERENGEVDYLKVIFWSATIQNIEDYRAGDLVEYTYATQRLEGLEVLVSSEGLEVPASSSKSGVKVQNSLRIEPDKMIEFLSEMLGFDIRENQLLFQSLMNFFPASLVRTRYGIEITNPFLDDITEMYSGIFATCFTISSMYENYTGKIPSNHEIAFITLQVGGVLHRKAQTARAVLIGTGGMAASAIIAANIESKISNLQIIAILPSQRINCLQDYECDIILWAGARIISDYVDNPQVIQISPIVSLEDIKNIKERCFELLQENTFEKNEFVGMLSADNIHFSDKKYKKNYLLSEYAAEMVDDGFVTKEFVLDILEREHIEATAIGNGVAIPHGKPENVIVPQIKVIKLSKPIDWGSRQKVDLVFILALNFENIKITKAFFKDFTRILNSPEELDRLKKSESSQELFTRLMSGFGWKV